VRDRVNNVKLVALQWKSIFFSLY